MKSSTSTGASTTAPRDGQGRGANRVSQPQSLIDLIRFTLEARTDLLEPTHQGALRLFNGFYEGWPELVVDVYARTLLIYNYANPPEAASSWLPQVQAEYLESLPWLQSVIVKARRASTPQERRGLLTFGAATDQQMLELGVIYALQLRMNQDAGFYLDTRNLRAWALENLAGKSVLNTFAYTGSLGIAARAAGARKVVFLDLNRRFLDMARKSYQLNGFSIEPDELITSDFFPVASRLRRAGERFDCVFLDPPFFSSTGKGTVDFLTRSQSLINKVRPLVENGGYLVVINNALFLSGADFLRSLDELAQGGYLSIETLIPVPQDVTGYPHTVVRKPPADPGPFNHPTKIAVLQIQHK